MFDYEIEDEVSVAQTVTETLEAPGNSLADQFLAIPGPQGPIGDLSGTFTWSQDVPSAAWTINHNLGYFPNVMATDSTGRQVLGEVVQVDNNNLQINFTAAFAGKAYLS